MKRIFLTILISLFLFIVNGFSQKLLRKSLYFYQDTVSFLGCGVIKSVDILYFVSDTSRKKNRHSEYYVAVKCAETYGKYFFKKGRKYNLLLSKNFKKIKPYLPPSTLKKFIQEEHFFLAEKINSAN